MTKNFERQNNRWEINTKGHSSKVINAGWEWEIKTNGNNVGSVGSYKKNQMENRDGRTNIMSKVINIKWDILLKKFLLCQMGPNVGWEKVQM
jgi:hypothetical protein